MTPIYGGPVEKIETLTYVPGLAGGTDLEAATKTISNTSENAVADYTSIHTLPAPTDSRIAVLRGCMRRSFTIDSVGGGCTTLNWRVKRGGVSVATGAIAVAGAPLTSLLSWDITTLITGAQSNTIFFWVDAGTCVLSEVTLWTAVGSMQAGATNASLSITHTGHMQLAGYTYVIGTGNEQTRILTVEPSAGAHQTLYMSPTATGWQPANSDPRLGLFLSPDIVYLLIGFLSVATSMGVIHNLSVFIRSQQ